MKKIITGLLAALMLLTLAACGSGNGDTSGNDAAGGTDSGTETESTATVSGVVNRLGDFLVLLTEDGEYQTFDFGEGVDVSGLEEGDSVTVTYTGELGSEDTTPVAVSVEEAES